VPTYSANGDRAGAGEDRLAHSSPAESQTSLKRCANPLGHPHGIGFVPEVVEHDIQVAIAVQVGHACGVVIRPASIQAIASAEKEAGHQTHHSQRQEQKFDLRPSGKDDRRRIVMDDTFPDHRCSPQEGQIR
jgi:hypothetical protein